MISELDRLIEEQRKDDAQETLWPERFVSFSLDAGGGMTADGFSYAEVIGVDDDGTIINYIPAKKGTLIGASYHGTNGGYSNRRCRCDRCRDAHTKELRDYRRRMLNNPDKIPHGTSNGYNNYGCRCEPCTVARRVKDRALREARRARGHVPTPRKKQEAA